MIYMQAQARGRVACIKHEDFSCYNFYYRITGKFDEYCIWRMSHLNVIGGYLASQAWLLYTALTLRPLENLNLAVFNLAINSQIRQIKTTAQFSRYTVCVLYHDDPLPTV